MVRFGIVAKDKRMEHLARLLREDGYPATLWKEPMPEEADVIVLPVGGGFDLLPRCRGKTVFCGGKPPAAPDVCMISYTADAYFQAANAVPTAEAALMLAMERTDVTLHGSRCAVLGYGNIGRCLCDRLLAWGAQVTVAARSPAARAQAENSGACAYGFPALDLTAQEIIFNTVPAPVLNDAVLATAARDVLIIDLASAPGGTDFDSARRRGLQVIHALALPGKYLPHTAAKILERTILSLLPEV